MKLCMFNIQQNTAGEHTSNKALLYEVMFNIRQITISEHTNPAKQRRESPVKYLLHQQTFWKTTKIALGLQRD